MMILQAYVDDSASDSGDRRMFLAGYIMSAPGWEAFSNAWDEELRAAPAIGYFKMVEAQSRRGEFDGWSEAARDRKVLALAKIVHEHDLRFIFCSASRKEYKEILAPVITEGLKTPYFVCFWGVINATARHHKELDLPETPVDFIFDEQGGLGDDALLCYRWLKESEDPAIRHLLGSTPIFRDDKKVVALQAADMLAWHVRRDHERGGLEDKTIYDLLTNRGLGLHVDRETLESLAKRMAKVPGVKRIQTKPEWRETKRNIRAYEQAGGAAPSTNWFWMRYIAFRAWLERTVHRWRYPRR